MGRFLADTFNYRKAYGKAGPLQEAPYKRRDGPYEKGRSLTRRAGVPYGSFTKRDDEEGSPLQGGSVLTGRADRLTGSLTRRNGPYGKGRGPLRGWVGNFRFVP